MESAVPLLIKKLDGARDFDTARTYANILLSHKERLAGARVRKLLARMLELLAKNDERARAYLWLARTTEPRLVIERLIESARAVRRRRKHDLAERYLRLLLSGEEPPPLARFELAVTLLRRGSHAMQKSAREKDEALSEIAKLVAGRDLDLPRMLKKERDLKDEDLFYVGFHFSERIGAERAFGGKVLRLVATGRGKLAKSARDKLKIEGLAERASRAARPLPSAEYLLPYGSGELVGLAHHPFHLVPGEAPGATLLHGPKDAVLVGGDGQAAVRHHVLVQVGVNHDLAVDLDEGEGYGFVPDLKGSVRRRLVHHGVGHRGA